MKKGFYIYEIITHVNEHGIYQTLQVIKDRQPTQGVAELELETYIKLVLRGNAYGRKFTIIPIYE